VNSLQKGIKITEKSIEDLVSALESNDKQTLILSSKSLSIAANDSVIDNSTLMKLREHTANRVPDVSIYTKLAYVRGLARLAEGKSSISVSHI
jgi:hypothetical protein